MRRFLILFPAFVIGVVVIALLFPMGEVVTLVTVDSDGREHRSALWVVELDEHLHLRAGDPESRWLARLELHPLVELVRDGERHAYRAVVVDEPAVRDAVNEAMAGKYGLADAAVRGLAGVERATPVRLEPLEDPDDGHRH